MVKSLPEVGAAKARVNEVIKLNNFRHLPLLAARLAQTLLQAARLPPNNAR
jgi:hypothetical protein